MKIAKHKQILSHFRIVGTPVEVVPVGKGLINDTFKVITEGDTAPDYVLQRINHAIFKDVALLQRNIEVVTRHIRKKLEAGGSQDIERKVLRFIPADNGSTYWQDEDGCYWRVSVFIPRTQGFDTVTAANAYDAGRAFGHFEAMLADLDVPLGETIPDFHNMELRVAQMREAVARDAVGRLGEVQDMVDALEQQAERMCMAERLYREGRLPKRICHCDSKVSNVLFDEDGRVLCVIDLDTVMPSFVFSDYGDFLRTAANTVEEDDPRPDHVGLRWDVVENFSRGFVEAAAGFLTPTERDMLPFAMALFPYMQCVRFLTDYINGDTYYKIRYASHNLDRARNQYRLYQLAVEGEKRLQHFIENL